MAVASTQEIINAAIDSPASHEVRKKITPTASSSSGTTTATTNPAGPLCAPAASTPPPAYFDTSAWHLHVKALSRRIDFDRLLALACDDDEYARRFAYASGWALDPSRYDPVKTAFPNKRAWNCPYTTLSSKDVKVMLERGVIRIISPDEIEGHVILFRVPEPQKQRWRPIRFTRDINEILDHNTIMPVNMATKKDIVELLHKGSHCIAFDAASFFDQFPIHPKIGSMMCFRKGRKYYALATAPMGQRQSVELAHTAMEKLVHHPELECSTAVIIDNAILVGSAEQCLRDAKAFLGRCNEVGCTINEDTSSVESLVSTKQDWGGVSLDFSNKTTCLTEKFVEKVKLSWSLRQHWSRESFASHMGLLFWAIGLIECYPGDYFPALQRYTMVSREAALLLNAPAAVQKEFWAGPIEISGVAEDALAQWTEAVIANTPRVAVKDTKEDLPDWLFSVDACRSGFGYVAINCRTGEIFHHGQRWSAPFVAKYGHKLHRSVFTEPEGVIMSLCHRLPFTGKTQRVHIFTDSVTTMSAGNKGFCCSSADVNSCIARLRKLFPPDLFRFSFFHIAGVENEAADAASRGRVVTEVQLEGAAAHMLASYGGAAP